MALVAEGGCSLDVAGLGELLAAERAGVDPGNIVLHGNAKSDAEIAKAIEMRRLRYIVVDNLDDVVRIADGLPEPVPVLLRVSPGIQAETDAKMATGHDASKFGIPSHQVDDAIRRDSQRALLDLRGLHAHVGSQILNVEQFGASGCRTGATRALRRHDLGGGFGDPLRQPTPPQASRSTWTDWWGGPSAPGNRRGSAARTGPLDGRSERVTVYRVVTVKRGVAPMWLSTADGRQPPEVALYGQPFEPSIIDKAGASRCATSSAGSANPETRSSPTMPLVDPQAGDLLVIPATGATRSLCPTTSGALPAGGVLRGRASAPGSASGDLRGTPGSRPTLSPDAAESICRTTGWAWSVIGIGRRQVGLYIHRSERTGRAAQRARGPADRGPGRSVHPDIVAVPTPGIERFITQGLGCSVCPRATATGVRRTSVSRRRR